MAKRNPNPDTECDDLDRSTCFQSACYNDTQDALDVTFRHGQRRRYYGVGERRAQNLMNAASPGRHYNNNVKGQFPTRKLPGRR